jgi:hypothetical protein
VGNFGIKKKNYEGHRVDQVTNHTRKDDVANRCNVLLSLYPCEGPRDWRKGRVLEGFLTEMGWTLP